MSTEDIQGSKSNEPALTVVGIGASAGGLQALRSFFSEIPRDSGLAFVIVVHLSPDYKSILSELLQPSASIPVQQVTATIPIEPNNVYVIPPNAHLNSIDTHLRLSELEEKRIHRAPVDHFFRTLANTHDGNSIGIILTGTGSDGSLGVKEIKGRNGLVIVQDPNDAEYDGMPQSAIVTGIVDLVLPLKDIPKNLLRITRVRPKIVLPATDSQKPVDEDDQQMMQKVFAQIRAKTGRDFSRYKISTIMRRMERRMQLYQIIYLKDYLELLRKDSNEVRALSDDFLITVTNFFRDPEVFEVLEKEILPNILKAKRPDQEVRVWSVGCATGEEAYSLAILLAEAVAKLEAPLSVQIFASDLHDHSLRMARDGFYTGDIETDITEQRLKRYFIKEDGGYRVRKDIREMVIFTPHNLMGDPPFSKLDLLVCRNLLIYLKRDVQRDIFDLFHYALKPNGYLVLGTSEHLENSELFRVEHKEKSIYSKRNVIGPEPRLPVFPFTTSRIAKEHQHQLVSDPISFGALHQQIVERYAPPSILISLENQVLHLSEHAGRYLIHPGGEPTQNLFKLLREELRIDIRNALHDAREKGSLVRTSPISIQIEGRIKQLIVSVKVTEEPGQEQFALILFEEHDIADLALSKQEEADDEKKGSHTYSYMEAELGISQQRLEAIIEEYESTREEMKASNEELQSANEELRSTLEELETSKEELQSMNEELTTVNQENRNKVEELSRLSSDLQNLLSATDIATLFLDREFRILRFTPRLGEIFSIRSADRGRPITDLTHKLGYPDLIDDAKKVLTNLVPVECEVQDQDAHWYLSRILPYRSAEDKIEGIVITLVDITRRKQMEDNLRRSEERLRKMININGVGVLIFDDEGVLVDANDTFLKITGYSRNEVKSGQLTWQKMTPAEYMDVSAEQHEGLHKTGHIGPYEKEYLLKDGSQRWMMFAGASLGDGTMVEYVMDISDRKKAERDLLESQASLLETRHLLTLARGASKLGWGAWDFKSGEAQWDDRAREIIGLSDQENSIEQWLNKILEEDRNHVRSRIDSARLKGDEFDIVYRVMMDPEHIRYVHHTGAFSADTGDGFAKGTGHVKDVTENKILEQSKDDFIKIAAHELKTPVTVLKGYVNMVAECLEEKGDMEQASYLRKTDKQINKIVSLINDMLEISRIEAGRLEIDSVEMDFDEAVREVVEEMQHISDHRLKLTGQTRKKVHADRERVGQVLINFISNAVKYSPKPEPIKIKLSTNNNHVQVTVMDYGEGIKKEELDKIFDRFYRVKKKGFQPSGLGLGLYISSEIIKGLNGEIWVDSTEGKGSAFGFSLPVC